jgi:hypothetical protein
LLVLLEYVSPHSAIVGSDTSSLVLIRRTLKESLLVVQL